MNPLEQLAVINNKIVPCSEEPFCLNGSSCSIKPRCNECRLSPNLLLSAPRHYWKPRFKNQKHPILEKEKRDAKHAKTLAKREAEKAKDPDRKTRSREAERAERKTEREIIHATKNSGRSNKDGDHVFGNITLDTKLQSQKENPQVNLYELDKVRRDAARTGTILGALVIRNKAGRGVIVIDERDITKIL